MENSLVLYDTCLLIDFFRTKDKTVTWYAQLVRNKCKIALSSVVIFELFVGADENNRKDFENIDGIQLIPR